jgi:hypothetical protein
MSTIHWLTPEELSEWDAFVGQHPLGLVYHTSAWQRVLENAFGHIRGRFLALRDGSGTIRAGLPIYTVKSWLLKDRTVSVPFATMCDPLIATKEDFDQLWPAIEEASGKIGSRRIEIRARRCSPECMPAGLTAGEGYKHHYLALGGKNPDALFRSFSQSCVRRRVDKAKRAGLVAEERHDDESLRVFHAMLVATRRRRSLPPMPFAFFREMYRCLSPDHVSLYFAMHEGKPVGGLMALKFKDMWTMEYNGDADGSPAGTNQFLCWETIQRAKESGAEFYSFGRTSLDNASLLEYKSRWATVEEDLTDFVCLAGSKAAQPKESPKAIRQALYGTAKQLLRHAPPAVQQSFGDFCYRHLG